MALARILVVEDDAAIRRGLVDALKFASYEALEAADGQAGLASALGAEVDLVLLDVLMPKMDGFTVLKELRKAKPALPVIVLTAKGEEQDRVRGLKEGADDYVGQALQAATELLARVEAVPAPFRRTPAQHGKSNRLWPVHRSGTARGRPPHRRARSPVPKRGRRHQLPRRQPRPPSLAKSSSPASGAWIPEASTRGRST